MKNYAAFDADGTLFRGFSILPVYDRFVDEGYITSDAHGYFLEPFRSYIGEDISYGDFVRLTLRNAAQVVKGKSVDTAEQIASLHFQEAEWFSYVQPTLIQLCVVGVEPVLVTAEPQFIASAVANKLEIKQSRSSLFSCTNGLFDGLVELALGSAAKAEALRGLGVENIHYAFGDSEGDIGMLSLAKLGSFCIQPSDELLIIANERQWTVVHDPMVDISLV